MTEFYNTIFGFLPDQYKYIILGLITAAVIITIIKFIKL